MTELAYRLGKAARSDGNGDEGARDRGARRIYAPRARGVSDELFRRLREQFDEGEIVEIAAVAGLFNYFNRFNNALEMEPTR